MTVLTTTLLWFSAITCGLLAGLYFAFSTFILQALGRIAAPAGVAAMNSINIQIQRSLFMPLFLGSSLAALLLALLALFQWQLPGSAATLVGGIVYVVGMFGCTMAFNVPLNNALAAPHADNEVWVRYRDVWTRWNHVRTVSSTVAMVLFIYALAVR